MTTPLSSKTIPVSAFKVSRSNEMSDLEIQIKKMDFSLTNFILQRDAQTIIIELLHKISNVMSPSHRRRSSSLYLPQKTNSGPLLE